MKLITEFYKMVPVYVIIINNFFKILLPLQYAKDAKKNRSRIAVLVFKILHTFNVEVVKKLQILEHYQANHVYVIIIKNIIMIQQRLQFVNNAKNQNCIHFARLVKKEVIFLNVHHVIHRFSIDV